MIIVLIVVLLTRKKIIIILLTRKKVIIVLLTIKEESYLVSNKEIYSIFMKSQ